MYEEAKKKGDRPPDWDFSFISDSEPKEKYDVGARSTATLPTGPPFPYVSAEQIINPGF